MSTPSTTPTRTTIAVPGGRATLVAEVVEHCGDETGDVYLQALERTDGAVYVRAGYRRGGRFVRGPVSAPIDAWARLLATAFAAPPLAGIAPPRRGASAGSRRRA